MKKNSSVGIQEFNIATAPSELSDVINDTETHYDSVCLTHERNILLFNQEKEAYFRNDYILGFNSRIFGLLF